jgi:hypothetical protein
MWAVAVPMLTFVAPEGDCPRCCTVEVTKRGRSSIGVWRGE